MFFAQNNHDLYKAQGYLTAKHRLWQIEFQTYAAAGRLAELFGEAALDYDRTERRRGMGYGADQAMAYMEKYDTETLEYVKDYAAGVNAYINQLNPEDYPVEYKLLDYTPEEWTPKKTALLLMYMTKMLAGGDDDLEYTNTLRMIGKKTLISSPDFFDKTDPVIPSENGLELYRCASNAVSSESSCTGHYKRNHYQTAPGQRKQQLGCIGCQVCDR